MATWSTPPKILIQNIKDKTAKIAQAATYELFGRVERASPVDEGTFRGNWNFGIGAPDLSVNLSARDPDGQRADTQAEKAYETPVGGIVYFTNALPYANALEHGWSNQAPRGMVSLTSLQWDDIVAEAAADSRNK